MNKQSIRFRYSREQPSRQWGQKTSRVKNGRSQKVQKKTTMIKWQDSKKIGHAVKKQFNKTKRILLKNPKATP